MQKRIGPQPKTISERKIHKKRSGANRAPEFIVSVAEVVREHLRKITRKITQEIGTIRRTTWRIVKVERNYKTCAKEAPVAHPATAYATYIPLPAFIARLQSSLIFCMGRLGGEQKAQQHQ